MGREAGGSGRAPRSTEAVEEAAVRIRVDGQAAACIACTPEDLPALAAGWCRARGLVARRDDIAAIDVQTDAAGPRVDVRLARPNVLSEPGCGALAELLRLPPPPRAPAHLPAPERFADLLRVLFEAGLRGQVTGGFHAAALSDGSALAGVVEDVSRHAAVDKVIGRALLEGLEVTRLGLVLSSRISGEIALKAARAELAWVASRSVPTTLAVAVADASGLPLVARAGAREARVFGGTGR